MKQYEELLSKKEEWGENWVLGGDFNDIGC